MSKGFLAAAAVITTVSESLRSWSATAVKAAVVVAAGASPTVELSTIRNAPSEPAAGTRWPGFHAITAQIQRRALLDAYAAAAGNKTAAGVLLGFHLSPGEEHVPGRPLTESRRNLALRKFRYWSSRLGIAGPYWTAEFDFRLTPASAPQATAMDAQRRLAALGAAA